MLNQTLATFARTKYIIHRTMYSKPLIYGPLIQLITDFRRHDVTLPPKF